MWPIYKLYIKQYYHTGVKFGAHIQIIYKEILSYRVEVWGPYTNYIQSNIIIQGWSLGPIYKLYIKQYYHTGQKFGAHIQMIYKAILSCRAEVWGPYTNYIQSDISIQGWSLGHIYKLYTKQYYHTGLKCGAHIQIIYRAMLSYRAEVWDPYINYIQSNIIIQGWSLGPIYKLYTKQYYHTGLKFGAHIQIIYKAILSYRTEVWGPYTNYIQSNIIIQGWSLGPIYKIYRKQYYHTALKFGAHIQIIYKVILSYRAEAWDPYTNYIQSNIIIQGWSLGPIYKLYIKQYYHTGLKFGAHIQMIYKAIFSCRAEVWGPYTNYIQSDISIQGWSLGHIYKLYTKQYYHTGLKCGAHIQIIYKAILSYRAEVWGPYTNYIQSNIIIQGWSVGPIYKLYTEQCYHTGLKFGAHIQIIYKAILSYRGEVWGPYTNYIQSNIIIQGWSLGPIYKLYTKQYYHTGLKFGPNTNYIQSDIIIQGWSLWPIYKLYIKQYYHTGVKFGAHIQIIYKEILSYRAEVWGPYTNYIQSNIIIQGWSLGPIYKLYTEQCYHTGLKFGTHIQIIYKAILSYRGEVWGPYTNYIQSNIIIQGWSLVPIYKLYTKQCYHTGRKFGAHIQITYKAT